MMRAIALAVTLLTVTQSPATMAAVAIFAANVDRKWPTDEREPFVTAEALRLMEAAASAIADETKTNTGKVNAAIIDFSKARVAAVDQRVAEDDRARLIGNALVKGQSMLEALVAAHADATLRQRLIELKRSAEALDQKRPLRQQGDALERYFHQAADVLRALLTAAPANTV